MNDLISRKDAIEHLKKRLWETALNNEGEAAEVFAGIADDRLDTWMAEIRPAQQWIPVKEGLPKPGQWVITTYERTYLDTGRTRRLVDYTIYCARTGWNDAPDIKTVAWMPMPEPFKEEE